MSVLLRSISVNYKTVSVHWVVPVLKWGNF